MKQAFITVFVLLILTGQSFSQCADISNIYTFTYNGKKYEVVKEKKNWVDAAACAVERGGYLVEINDLDEQNAVYDAIINGAGVSPTYTSISNGGGIAYVWIGATDQQNEGVWLWDGNNDNIGMNFWTGQGANGLGNGSPVDSAYYNWGGTSVGVPKEPDNYNGQQHHAAIGLAGWPAGTTNLGVAGEWNDIIGSSSLYFVIEFDESIGVGNHSIQKSGSMCFYPNPATDKITVNGERAFVSIELFNILGQRIYMGTNREISLASYKKGVYFIKAFDGTEHFIGKFLLQ